MRLASPWLLLLSYLAFISLGLPDTVLGVAWPSVRDGFAIAQSSLGLVLAAGLAGYFTSGLIAGSLTERLGVGGLLAASSGLVATALVGYALAPAWVSFFPMGLLLGLGSGAIDSGLNGYAARHYSARHMNWLHACWGVGASTGPVIMTAAIARGFGYRAGYAALAVVLGAMTLAFVLTRRAWNDGAPATSTPPSASSAAAAAPELRSDVTREVRGDAAPEVRVRRAPPLGALAALRSRGVALGMVTFFFYTGIESTTGQWCFTLLRERRGLSIEAAGAWTAAYWASLTAGRVALGFIVDRLGADVLLRWATWSAVIGATCFALGEGALGGLGLLLLGVSLAPIFPTLVSRTPARFGSDVARHAVGFQVSMATLGSTLMPSLVGVIAARVGLDAIPASVLVASGALFFAHEALLRLTRPALAAPAPG